ncbi:MAG: xanthine dehydrogenase small subunit [Emcibacter sp.]|nr:xanthine dehydrogenase small subunit [Emcibacter sp.]
MAQKNITLLLGGQPHEVINFDPTRTLLDYLRYDSARTGTKEGCGEGDCGACTVVIGTLKDGKLRFEAVNSCIIFLPTLDGKLLLTVEDLVHPDGSLHVIQRVIADLQGSQCGFCTPGFVMAIFAHIRSGGGAGLASINDALVGNLCRCTGYGPIIEAVRRAISEQVDDHLTALEETWIKQLAAMSSPDTLSLSWICPDTGKERHYSAPKTTAALTALYAAYPEATLLAGGTDVGLWVTKQLQSLNRLIYLGHITELSQITQSKTHIEIGAGVTFADAQPILSAHFPDLGEVIRRLGSSQIRNRATIGGNIANGSPIGDSMPVLIALNTELALQSVKGLRRIPLEDYFISYGRQDRIAGEFVAAIRIPLPKPDQYFRAYKISKRFDQDISAVCGAISVTLDDGLISSARVAYGGVAATPIRALNTENTLIGAKWNERTIQSAMSALKNDLSPISDMRASADYRLKVARNILFKAYIEYDTPLSQTRLIGDGAAE